MYWKFSSNESCWLAKKPFAIVRKKYELVNCYKYLLCNSVKKQQDFINCDVRICKLTQAFETLISAPKPYVVVRPVPLRNGDKK